MFPLSFAFGATWSEEALTLPCGGGKPWGEHPTLGGKKMLLLRVVAWCGGLCFLLFNILTLFCFWGIFYLWPLNKKGILGVQVFIEIHFFDPRASGDCMRFTGWGVKKKTPNRDHRWRSGLCFLLSFFFKGYPVFFVFNIYFFFGCPVFLTTAHGVYLSSFFIGRFLLVAACGLKATHMEHRLCTYSNKKYPISSTRRTPLTKGSIKDWQLSTSTKGEAITQSWAKIRPTSSCHRMTRLDLRPHPKPQHTTNWSQKALRARGLLWKLFPILANETGLCLVLNFFKTFWNQFCFTLTEAGPFSYTLFASLNNVTITPWCFMHGPLPIKTPFFFNGK